MNPTNPVDQSNFELPKPQPRGDLSPQPHAPELTGAVSPHEQAVTPSVAPHSNPMAQPASVPATDTGAHGVQTPAPNSQAVTQDDLMADDADLIEKEWVTKAKKIVDQTRNDPREQSKQMYHVKADYIKKRYNKDLKVNEG